MPSEHFHDYILEWSEEELIFLVDYEEVLRVNQETRMIHMTSGHLMTHII